MMQTQWNLPRIEGYDTLAVFFLAVLLTDDGISVEFQTRKRLKKDSLFIIEKTKQNKTKNT